MGEECNVHHMRRESRHSCSHSQHETRDTQTIWLQGGLAPACAGDQLTSQARVGVCAAVLPTHALSRIHFNHWAWQSPMRALASAHLHNSQSLPHSHQPPYLQVQCLPHHTQHTQQTATAKVLPCCSAGTSSSRLMCCTAHLLVPYLHATNPIPRPHAKETTQTPTAAVRLAAGWTPHPDPRRLPLGPTAHCSRSSCQANRLTAVCRGRASALQHCDSMRTALVPYEMPAGVASMTCRIFLSPASTAIAPSGSTSMMTTSPSLMSPHRMRSAKQSSMRRMMARRRGRAP